MVHAIWFVCDHSMHYVFSNQCFVISQYTVMQRFQLAQSWLTLSIPCTAVAMATIVYCKMIGLSTMAMAR
jgi:ABC-type glycerol-3-phosphate transport system permease component